MNNQKGIILSATLIDAVLEYKELEKKKDSLAQRQGELSSVILGELKKVFQEEGSITVDVPGTDLVELDLSIRAINALRRKGYSIVEEVAECSISELSQIRGMGKISLEEIVSKLKEKGIILKP